MTKWRFDCVYYSTFSIFKETKIDMYYCMWMCFVTAAASPLFATTTTTLSILLHRVAIFVSGAGAIFYFLSGSGRVFPEWFGRGSFVPWFFLTCNWLFLFVTDLVGGQ